MIMPSKTHFMNCVIKVELAFWHSILEREWKQCKSRWNGFDSIVDEDSLVLCEFHYNDGIILMHHLGTYTLWGCGPMIYLMNKRSACRNGKSAFICTNLCIPISMHCNLHFNGFIYLHLILIFHMRRSKNDWKLRAIMMYFIWKFFKWILLLC